MSLIEQNQKIVAKYRESGQVWPATAVDIARWAISKKLLDIHPRESCGSVLIRSQRRCARNI
jgi:hypothetical protein